MSIKSLKTKIENLRNEREALKAERNRELALTDEIQAAQDELQAAELTAKRRKVATKHKAEREAWLAVVAGVQALQTTLNDLENVRDEIIALEGAPQSRLIDPLRSGVAAALADWQNWTPEILGKPPRPSLAEERKLELERQVQRLNDLVVSAKKTKRQARNGTGQIQRMIESYEQSLSATKARLAAL